MKSRCLLLAAAALLALVPIRARAQGESPGTLVDRALDLRRTGDDLGARELLLQAYDREPAPRTTAQLGVCEQALGLWVEAEAHLLDALAVDSDTWVRAHRRQLERSLETVRANLGTLEILTDVPGASVRVGGVERGTTPLHGPLRVAAGRVEVEVSLGAYRTQQVTITVEPGSSARQLLVMVRDEEETTAISAFDDPLPVTAQHEPAPEPPLEPVAAPARDVGPGIPVWTWPLLGGAVVFAAVGIGVGVHTQSVYDGLAATCGVSGCTDAQIDGSGVEASMVAANVMLGVAGALAVAGVVVLVLELSATPGEASVALGPGTLHVETRF